MRRRTERNLATVKLSGFAVFTILLCSAVLSSTPHLQAQKSEAKHIVRLHGACADDPGSMSAPCKSRRRLFMTKQTKLDVCQWQKTEPSALLLSDGTPVELTATQSKSQAPATQSTSRIPRKLQA
jgi:hypothetical protein